MLPIKTTLDDIEVVGGYLRTQVGWVELDRVRKAIPATHADNRKIEAMRFVGLLERDGANIKLTAVGREYASADEARRRQILQDRIKSVDLYARTVEWMHFSRKATPTKTEVANYWHDSHQSELSGATGAALTDAVIFFLRLAGAAGLGQFIAAGKGRPETYLKVDHEALSAYINNSEEAPKGSETPDSAKRAEIVPEPVAAHQPARPSVQQVTASPAVHINIEIHIAADATATTVEEIFKNMRKYVLAEPEATDGA